MKFSMRSRIILILLFLGAIGLSIVFTAWFAKKGNPETVFSCPTFENDPESKLESIDGIFEHFKFDEEAFIKFNGDAISSQNPQSAHPDCGDVSQEVYESFYKVFSNESRLLKKTIEERNTNVNDFLKEENYRTVFQLRNHVSSHADDNNPIGCTSLLVGPQALLVAAHCISEKKTYAIHDSDESKAVKVRCRRHPGFALRGLTHDIALCLLNRPMKDFESKFETVYLNYDNHREDNILQFAGYGCVDAQSKRPAGVLRVGVASSFFTERCTSIEKLSLLDLDYAHDKFRICTNKDAILREGAERIICDDDIASLCDGDSGGPLYYSSPHDLLQRSIVGVNSQVKNVGRERVSVFASFSNEPTVDFFQSWNSQCSRICGLEDYLAGAGENCKRGLMNSFPAVSIDK